MLARAVHDKPSPTHFSDKDKLLRMNHIERKMDSHARAQVVLAFSAPRFWMSGGSQMRADADT